MKWLFRACIILEIVLIIWVFVELVNKSRRKEVSFLDKNNLKRRLDSKYKNYYEPSDNYTELIPWENNKPILHDINLDTIKASKNYLLKKDSNTIRFVCLGDSFTFGQFVKDDEAYPFQLENTLKKNYKGKNKIEVINLGVPGFDVQYAVERYRLRGEKYNPDYVIWFLTSDDYTNIAEPELEITYFYQKNPLSSAQRKKYVGLIGNVPYIEYAIGSYEVQKKLTPNGILKYNLNIISQFSSILKNKLIIITFPFIEQEKRDQIKLICEKYKCSVFDKLPDVYKEKRLYLPDLHPSKEGYKEIVEVLNKELLKKIK